MTRATVVALKIGRAKYKVRYRRLLQACPGADWSKVQTWRDLAVAASVEKEARAKCAAEIEAISKLKPGGAR